MGKHEKSVACPFFCTLIPCFAARIAADPVIGEGRRVVFVAGDDVKGKSEVTELIESINFASVDLGTLAFGSRYIEAKGVFSGMYLAKL